MCSPALGSGNVPTTAACVGTNSTGSTGSSQGSTSYARPQITVSTNQVYFRITVAIQGPRNSVSYVQAMVQ
jgi:hypothetical protein